MKHVFVINPMAGRKNRTEEIRRMAKDLHNRHGIQTECVLTGGKGSAIDTVRSIAERGEPVRLYACGGDGTVNEVANGVAGYANAAMTCIPVGTGNDFLKNFGPDMMEKFRDPENLWDGPQISLDTIDCNGRYCMTIACNGIDARIADSVHRYTDCLRLHGRMSYLISVAVNFLFKPIGRHWTVYLDDERIEDDFALVSMVNGRYYGGGSTPVPEARMDDGLLHTVLVKNIPKLTFAKLFGSYSAGDHENLPKESVRLSDAKVVRIQSPERDIVSCLDGESMRSREVIMRLGEKKVNFFGPVGMDPNATARPISDKAL